MRFMRSDIDYPSCLDVTRAIGLRRGYDLHLLFKKYIADMRKIPLKLVILRHCLANSYDTFIGQRYGYNLSGLIPTLLI